jgi:C4-dicarboxylate transporter DctM subunit
LILGLVIATILVLMMLTRLPLGFSMALGGIAGIAAIHPRGLPAALTIAEQQFIDLALNFQMSALALFLTMGVFVARAGLADELFDAAYRWFGHRRGGLAMASIVSCAGFASVSGSSAAATSTMAAIAVPAMRRFGYSVPFSTGTVAAGGTLGILVPPSSALIIYGLLTDTNVKSLFIAALIPASVQIVAYIATIAVVTRYRPAWGPAGARSTWAERARSLTGVSGVVTLFALIIGGLLSGKVTTTEAGGVGAGGAMLIALLRRRLGWRALCDGLTQSARISGMIYLVAAGAMVLNQFVNLDGVPGAVMAQIDSLHLAPLGVVLLVLCFYVVLGLFIDGYAMLFLTVPIVAPIMGGLGMDLVWWGIVVIITVEMAMISHPFGLNICILKAALPEVSLLTIFAGVLPFLVADLLRLAVVVWVPSVVTFLPGAVGASR